MVVAGQPGTAAVTGGLGPFSFAFNGDAASPIPRFADTSADQAACAAAPCLTVVPGAIPLSYQTGTPPPGPITLQVGSTGSPLSFTAAVAASPDGWLSVSSSSGTTPASVQVLLSTH